MRSMKHMMEWTLAIMILFSVGNLAILYSPHVRRLSTTTDIFFLALLTFFAIAPIQNALDAMKQNKYLVPVCAMGAFFTAIILMFAVIYRHFGLIASNKPVTSPGQLIYFSVVTWTTTGYGDLVPTAASRFFAATEALYGYISMGVYVAMIVRAMF